MTSREALRILEKHSFFYEGTNLCGTDISIEPYFTKHQYQTALEIIERDLEVLDILKNYLSLISLMDGNNYLKLVNSYIEMVRLTDEQYEKLKEWLKNDID